MPQLLKQNNRAIPVPGGLYYPFENKLYAWRFTCPEDPELSDGFWEWVTPQPCSACGIPQEYPTCTECQGEEVQCKNCSQPFIKQHTHQRHCSNECARLFSKPTDFAQSRKLVARTCKFCHEDYEVAARNSGRLSQNFCSRDCQRTFGQLSPTQRGKLGSAREVGPSLGTPPGTGLP